MFSGLLFFADDDVDSNVLEHVEEQGGEIRSSTANKEVIWLVNQQIDRENHGKQYTRVFQNWVNMSIHQQRPVDLVPFTISGNSLFNKKTKTTVSGDRYTKGEDDKLWKFATVTHDGHDMTQAELWDLAEEEAVVPERTGLSMLKRYRELRKQRNVMDKTYRPYSLMDDQSIMRWAWYWYTCTHAEEGSIWEMAAAKRIVQGRNEMQLKGRYNRLVQQHKGAKELLRYAVRIQAHGEETWNAFFTKADVVVIDE